MTNAKEMWDAIKSRFGGNDKSKKMQKFQSLLSQLEIHGAGVSTEDTNKKFLRSLPSAWSQVSLITRTKPGVDSLNFDDLYNNLTDMLIVRPPVKSSLVLRISVVAFVMGLMQNHEAIVDYFNTKGVSMIFLFRRNLLRRRISILANAYDQSAKPLNGKHKSHVHSPDEAKILASYKPLINTTLLIPELQQADNMVKQAPEYFNTTRHIILYYEDIIKDHTVLNDIQDFLRIPRMGLKSRQVKIHKGPLREQVENWGDILKVLNGTPYESILHEDYKVS
ncbi:hypothetical protein Tco_0897678 [Tanacetum coccineum]